MKNTDLFNATIAITQAGGNEQLARELFAMLLKELPEHMTSIQVAFRACQNDLLAINDLWEPVHKLYGATAYLGVPALRDNCKTLENHINLSNHTEIENAVIQLMQNIEQLSQIGDNILNQDWD
ncbi:MAG: Hpt domain-containing protein [Gammaproteobacteria bacterium]|nr:Hpt domain-containing protein [Gammaproteobacteria bacterium]